MSLLAEIRKLYAQGFDDTAVRARLSGIATRDGLRGAMSKVRRENGIVLRPDLSGPRATRARVPKTRPLSVNFSTKLLDRLAEEAAWRQLSQGALVRQAVAKFLGDRP